MAQLECLECGYQGESYNFRQGCPLCGCWDSWSLEEKNLEIQSRLAPDLQGEWEGG